MQRNPDKPPCNQFSRSLRWRLGDSCGPEASCKRWRSRSGESIHRHEVGDMGTRVQQVIKKFRRKAASSSSHLFLGGISIGSVVFTYTAAVSPYFQWGRTSPKNCSFSVGIWTTSKTTKVETPKGISIGSAVFAGLTVTLVSNRHIDSQTHRQTMLLCM